MDNSDSAGLVKAKEVSDTFPSMPCEGVMQTCVAEEFSVKINLIESDDNDVLTPLGIDKGTGEEGYDKIKFRLEIKSDSSSFAADEVVIDVRKGGDLLHREVHTSGFVSVGKHVWEWDGYWNDVLDTALLRSGEIVVELTARKGARYRKDNAVVTGEFKESEWFDVVIDRANRKVDVLARLKLFDGGQSGEGTHQPSIGYADLQGMLLEGIRYHWSRPVEVDGVNYQVDVNPVIAAENAMELKLVLELGKEYSRSHNSQGDPLGELAHFFYSSRVYYNYGFFYPELTHAKLDYKQTAAHEFGHPVLLLYRDQAHSWGHKGTSGLLGGKGPRRPIPAQPQEIDLMVYHDRPFSLDEYARIKAIEDDVKALIWLARVEFESTWSFD